jgi:hypothetical protein
MVYHMTRLIVTCCASVTALPADSFSAPIDRRVRPFLERRFGRDLGFVRIYASHRAAELAAMFGARAFTLGRDIVFARDEYRPETDDGLRLLAHELTHVLQQSGGNLASSPTEVGSTDDPTEQEADDVARELFSDRRLPSITNDRRLILRRAVPVKPETAGIDIIAGQVSPTVGLNLGAANHRVAVMNLTNGFNPDPTLVQGAFNFLGHVKVRPGANLTGADFGFVQFIRHIELGVFYAGRRHSEGGISLLIGRAITQRFFVDAFSRATLPFMKSPNANFVSGEIDAPMGDHPLISVAQDQHNFATGVQNFLFHVVDEREAFSIFCARDAAGAFTFLANVRWTLRYDIKFAWSGGAIRVATNSSRFSVGPVALGAPNDPGLPLQSLGPAMSPLANEQARQAMSATFVHPNPNRTDNETRFINVPFLFFQ